jgi:transcription initiation factor TFIID subunit 8
MSQTDTSQQKSQPSKPQPQPAPERLTIKMEDIPTYLLEKLLVNFIQQINNTYRKTQGDIVIPDIETPLVNSIENNSKRRKTLSKINENIDISTEFENRLKYSNETIKKYNLITPNEIIEKKTITDSPMSDILQLSVLIAMENSIFNKFKDEYDYNLNIKENALLLMTEWAGNYIHLLTQRLQRLMEIQRRTQPNKDDLALLQREGLFDTSGIHDMYDLCNLSIKSKENKQKYENINNKANDALTAYNGHDNGAFNVINDGVQNEEQWWIDQVVRRKKRKLYIPEWMPSLPPDYTFKSTPKYNERITNLSVLRQKLVHEGRLGEKALDHIILKKQNQLFEESFVDHNISDHNISIESGDEKEEKRKEETEINNIDESNKTDFKAIESKQDSEEVNLVELAKKRMLILDKRRKEEESRIASRVESIESKYGRELGFYTNRKKIPDDLKDGLNKYRTENLSDLIHNLRKQEKWHSNWLIEQEALRKKSDDEKSKYAEANEIQLGGSGAEGVGSYNGFMGNIDEEVDFDVEFSDMEGFENEKNEQTSDKVEDTADKQTEIIMQKESPGSKENVSTEVRKLQDSITIESKEIVENSGTLQNLETLDTISETVKEEKSSSIIMLKDQIRNDKQETDSKVSIPLNTPDLEPNHKQNAESITNPDSVASFNTQQENNEHQNRGEEEEDIDMDIFED